MGQLGFGVMINMLKVNAESVDAWRKSVDKPISGIQVQDNRLTITLDTHKLVIQDEGQSCCESRYMNCDDNLGAFIGGTLLDATIETAPSPPQDEYGYGEHEIQFLHVKTSKGSFTVSNHNEHNGYYGGFSVECRTENL